MKTENNIYVLSTSEDSSGLVVSCLCTFKMIAYSLFTLNLVLICSNRWNLDNTWKLKSKMGVKGHQIATHHSPNAKVEVGEIDTSAPFQSVKDAVNLFGEGAFSGERLIVRKAKQPHSAEVLIFVHFKNLFI